MENNKKIALFMGAIYDEVHNQYEFTNRPDNECFQYWHEDDLKYHNSWDWLMPVIEKISSKDKIYVHFKFSSKSSHVEVYDNAIKETVSEGYTEQPNKLLQSAYECVVEFIENYNKL